MQLPENIYLAMIRIHIPLGVVLLQVIIQTKLWVLNYYSFVLLEQCVEWKRKGNRKTLEHRIVERIGKG